MAQQKHKATHAVVMGDLVGSEAAPSVRRLHADFNEAVRAVNRRRRKQLTSPLTITLGDEFQGLTQSLAAGLAVVRDLRTSLLADNVECRFVLGLVRLETPLNVQKSWNMMGPGLATARDKLVDKRHHNAYRFSLPDEPVLETLLDAIGLSITEAERGWTDRQFEIVGASMTRSDQNAELAARLGIAENTLYKIRRAARFDFYQTQWEALDVAIADLDRRHGLA